VEKIMDETREAVEYQNEIDTLLSGQLTAEDEDAVLAELDEITKVDLPEVPTEKVDMPEVPAEKLPDTIGVKVKEDCRIRSGWGIVLQWGYTTYCAQRMATPYLACQSGMDWPPTGSL
jgi:hypothetical protein